MFQLWPPKRMIRGTLHQVDTPSSFKALVLQQQWAIVSFWDHWDKNSALVNRAVEFLAPEFSNVAFTAAEYSKVRPLFDILDVRTKPTVILFYHGEPVSGRSGDLSIQDLRAWLTSEMAAYSS